MLFLGYGQTELDLRSPLVGWGHFLLGEVFGVLFFVHMGISVFLVRYEWAGSASAGFLGVGWGSLPGSGWARA
jgi:hypothetical protein